MKVLICDPIATDAVDKIKKAGFEVDIKAGIQVDELNSIISEYDAVIVRSATKIRKEQIEKASKLKVIGRGGVGLDNIDVDVAKAKGIAVVNTPGASSASVAELAISMMFALSRKIVFGSMTMREGKWEKKKMEGVELGGKTLGVIGFGNIGKYTAKLALGLGMNVIAFDPVVTKTDMNVKIVDFDTVLKTSDYITLHVPFDKAKGALLGKAEFAKMKKNCFLINCSRGGVVDEGALLEALNSDLIAGAGVDVFAEEPTSNIELVKHPNIITTPHIGASTVEGQTRVGDEIADRIVDELKKLK